MFLWHIMEMLRTAEDRASQSIRGHEIFMMAWLCMLSRIINKIFIYNQHTFIAWSSLWIWWTNGNWCIYEQKHDQSINQWTLGTLSIYHIPLELTEQRRTSRQPEWDPMCQQDRGGNPTISEKIKFAKRLNMQSICFRVSQNSCEEFELYRFCTTNQNLTNSED